MAEFLSSQHEYFFYFCGASFLVLASLTFPLARNKEEVIPWRYFSIFALIYGFTVWLEVIAMGFGDGAAFKAARTALYGAGFYYLLEFGRSGTASLGARVPGRAIHLPIALLACAGGIYGIEGLSATVRYFMGVPGCLWAVLVLWRHREKTEKRRPVLTLSAVLPMAGGLILGAVPPPALFPPASLLNEATFMAAAGFPVQVLHGALAMAAVMAVWRYGRALRPNLPAASSRRRMVREVVFISIYFAVIIAGCLFVIWAGTESENEKRRDIKYLVHTGVISLDPGRIARLTGTGADLANPDYRRLKEQLVKMKRGTDSVRFYYLVRLVNGTAIFLADSEPENSPDYSPPGQVYEEINPQFRKALGSRDTLVTGPAKDRWGTWITASAPVFGEGGGIIATLGIDIEVSRWQQAVIRERVRAILLVMFFSCTVLLFYTVNRRMREVQELMESVAGEQSLLLNTVSVQIWYLTDPETYGLVNDAHAAFLGRNAAEVSHHNLKDFLNVQEALQRIEKNREVFASGKRVDSETWITDGRGERRLLNIVMTPELNERGAVVYVACSAVDITEQKIMEAALRLSEARFRSYFELPLIGIAITSMRTELVEVNDRLCEILGRSREELAEMTWSQVLYPDERSSDFRQYERLLAGEIDSYTMDRRFVGRDGEVVWTSIAVGCVRNPDRTVDFVLVLIQDISGRKIAEEALHESEKRYRLIAENSSDVIWTLTLDGRLMYVSPAITPLTGFTPEEVIGTPLARYIPSAEYEPLIRGMLDELKAPREKRRRSGTLELRQYARDGSLIDVEVNYSWLLNENGETIGIQGSNRDIRARKKAEVELAKSLEEKGALLRELQHRVKNSLTMIVGLVDLESHRVDDPATQLVLEQLRDRVMSLSRLYDLLYRTEDVRDVRLDQYLEQICRSIVESYIADSERITLSTRLDETRVKVKSAIPLGLAVNEILTNALKYAFPDGRKGLITVTLSTGTDTLVLDVSDNGRGMPPGVDEKTSKGMGSQLIRMMIQQLKGTITVERKDGTLYHVEIPRAKL